MNNEFTSLVKSLKVPLLTATEVATLTQLQKQWEHWKQRELEHMPLRIEPHQNAAYAAFLDNPTAECEQRLLVHADRNLTGTAFKAAHAPLHRHVEAGGNLLIAKKRPARRRRIFSRTDQPKGRSIQRRSIEADTGVLTSCDPDAPARCPLDRRAP
jgi:hypothetical protein